MDFSGSLLTIAFCLSVLKLMLRRRKAKLIENWPPKYKRMKFFNIKKKKNQIGGRRERNKIIILFYFLVSNATERTRRRVEARKKRGSSQMSFKYWFLILPIFLLSCLLRGRDNFYMGIVLTFCCLDVHLIICYYWLCLHCMFINN